MGYRVLGSGSGWDAWVPACPRARSDLRLMRRIGDYQHVGSVVWLDRTGAFMPGNYTAFAQERPLWYTGSTYDHHGYIMAIRQILLCNPAL